MKIANLNVKIFFVLSTVACCFSPAYTEVVRDNNDSIQTTLFKKVNRISNFYLLDEDIIGFNRAYSFSNDGKLFAFLQIYEDDLASIRIWDVITGELKYKTIINNYADAGGGSYIFLEFSPNDQTIFISGIVGYPLITWDFKKEAQVKISCQGYMGGNVQEISNDDRYYTVKTPDSEFSLCQPGIEGELANYKDWMPEEWWGRNTQTLHNGKILTIYNYRLASEAQHQPKEKPPAGIMEWVDLWDLNYISTANRLISQLDHKNNEFFLIGVFDNKMIINQYLRH